MTSFYLQIFCTLQKSTFLGFKFLYFNQPPIISLTEAQTKKEIQRYFGDFLFNQLANISFT